MVDRGQARGPTGAALTRGSGLKPVPGIDGLRAVAVVAVMAFHAGLGWANGGLLGVDVFFVISGFLVTSLLLQEHSITGTIDPRRFWSRRARRLLPGLLVLLAGISLYARWQGSGVSPTKIRGDAFASLFYFANWHYILSGQNYFVRFGAPSPLLHTWSLAVEEQFYLVWPLIVLLVMKRYGTRALGWAAGALAVGSAVLSASLYQSGAAVDRIYYGTDTRSQALMVGALLAVVLQTSGSGVSCDHRRFGRGWLVSGAGLGGAITLALLLHSVRGNGPFLYRGGFTLVALASAAVLALTVRLPSHPLSRILAWSPLRFTGRISYGLYLYHWPLFLVLDATRTGLRGVDLAAVRFAATFAVAVLSFYLIEDPIRTGRGWFRVPLPRVKVAPVRALASPRTAGSIAAAVVVLALVTVSDPPQGPPSAAGASASPLGARMSPLAGSPGPQRALLLGDSMAVTLGPGLSVDSARWGVLMDNQGAIGCDVDPSTTVNVMGVVSRAAQGCPRWDESWSNLVERIDPDVVVVFLGRWETIDRLFGGRWITVGDPSFDRHLQTELGRIVEIGSARGARVVFLTLPYITQTTQQPNGAPWDMNLPARTDAYNADLRAAVARYPGRAALIDLNAMVDPGGHYVSYIGKVRVRDYDDEHLSKAGGEWLRPLILPRLAVLGSERTVARMAS